MAAPRVRSNQAADFGRTTAAPRMAKMHVALPDCTAQSLSPAMWVPGQERGAAVLVALCYCADPDAVVGHSSADSLLHACALHMLTGYDPPLQAMH